MIPEYFDKNCMIYQYDGLLFLNALSPESVQLIWTNPPCGADDQDSEGAKTVSQMEAIELCAAVADASFRVLASGGVLVLVLPNQNADGVMPAITKRTHFQFGGFVWGGRDLDNTIIVFHKGSPKFKLLLDTDSHSDIITSYIAAHTEPGDFIVDPFCGHGDVMEAAVNSERVAVMNDHDPTAIEATINRYKERCA